jgi:hypothetical protein
MLKTVCCVLRQRDVVVAPSADTAHLHIARAALVYGFSEDGENSNHNFREPGRLRA